MNENVVVHILEALAVGDSFGKSTEFVSRSTILEHFTDIKKLLTPEESLAHRDMNFAQVTDDTEQNVYLIQDYAAARTITPQVAAKSILRWYAQSPAPEKYIGPSSRKAIYAIQGGASVLEAGRTGTSCGGVMRAPAAVLCSATIAELQNNVYATLCPTHNTSAAMEAAMGYAYTLWAILEGETLDTIWEMAAEGCRYGRERYPKQADMSCVPACDYRIAHLLQVWSSFKTSGELLDFLFYVYGTTISSCDVFVAAYAIFLWAHQDVFLAIQMAAMLGGDTDTIGCLAAVLCCAYARGHNIPQEIVEAVRVSNAIDFVSIARDVQSFH